MGQIPAEEPIGLPVHNWEDEEELPAPSAKPRKVGAKKVVPFKQRFKRGLMKAGFIGTVATLALLWGINQVGNFYKEHTTSLQTPVIIQWPVKVEKRAELPAVEEPKPAASAIIPVAKAAEIEQPAEKEQTKSFPQAR